MTHFAAFFRDDSGAATTDWVVITGMLVGLAIATATMVYEGSGNTTLQLSGLLDATEPVSFQDDIAETAQFFYEIGIAAYPDNRDSAWRAARDAVHEAAPSGYEYDPGYTTTRFVDTVSGYPIYVSYDGQTYAIGEERVATADYDTGNRISFRNAFNAYFSDL
ncbi:hypothetical protein [Nioella aestuarii]|uniref:hypothetical protein n=1 Tax=Nioella aestuarii TaxID=1662864 RepID=UPI003D7FF209